MFTTEMEINGASYQVPTSYICPITLQIMTYPLLTKTGLRFERSAILSWLGQSETCPLTRQKMNISDLIRDRLMESEIYYWKVFHGIIIPTDQKEEEQETEDAMDFVGFIPMVIKTNRKTDRSIRPQPPQQQQQPPQNSSQQTPSRNPLRRVFRRHTAAASSA